MLDIIQQILDKTAGLSQSAEVFMFTSEETPVIFEANRLKSLQSKESRSISLRVFKNGRIGFASSNKPEDVDFLVQSAIETAEFGARGLSADGSFTFISNVTGLSGAAGRAALLSRK